MATHFSVLAWRIPGTGEPSGLPSMGSHRVGHDWSDLAAAAAYRHWTVRLLSRFGGLLPWYTKLVSILTFLHVLDYFLKITSWKWVAKLKRMCVLRLMIPSTKMISRKAAAVCPSAVSQWPNSNNSITAGNCQEKLCKTFFFFNLKSSTFFFLFFYKMLIQNCS